MAQKQTLPKAGTMFSCPRCGFAIAYDVWSVRPGQKWLCAACRTPLLCTGTEFKQTCRSMRPGSRESEQVQKSITIVESSLS